MQISQKGPPPLLPFGEILGSHCVMWCNFAKPYFMHHCTSHQGTGQRAPTPQWPNREKIWDWIYPFHAISSNFGLAGSKCPLLLPFCQRPRLCHTCGIPMVSILQINTQILPIWISSSGPQLCQLFKIITYTEVHRIMVQVEDLYAALPQYTVISLLSL